VGNEHRIHPRKPIPHTHLYLTDRPSKSKVRGILSIALTGALLAVAAFSAWLSLGYIYAGLLPL
jgi:hypothetical protein